MTAGYLGSRLRGYISRERNESLPDTTKYTICRGQVSASEMALGVGMLLSITIFITPAARLGPFNAWGRDKYWCLGQSHLPYIVGRSHDAGNVLVDAMETVIIRHNFFEEESGWGLDLDDGASYYEIYNNLCVGVSVKLREEAYLTIYNNIWVNGANSLFFHIGNEDNHDRYFRNITVMSIKAMKPEDDLNFRMGKTYGEVYTLIAPPAHGPWLEE